MKTILILLGLSLTQAIFLKDKQIFTSFDAEKAQADYKPNTSYVMKQEDNPMESEGPGMDKDSPSMNLKEILKNDQLTDDDKQKLSHRPEMPDREPQVLLQEQKILEKEILQKEVEEGRYIN